MSARADGMQPVSDVEAPKVSLPAGQIQPCGGGHDHNIKSVHVVVLCECGSAYRSTDATIALAMASRHDHAVAVTHDPTEIKP